MATVAVVLAGSGFLDGTEITEAVSCLIHLARLGAQYECFAPDIPQADVVDHARHEPVRAEKRSVLAESARIARGKVQPLSRLDPARFDAVVFPGGYGAAKNLCTFAKDGANCSVIPDVERVVRGFHGAGKPVAMCCISPVIAARVLGKAGGGPGVEVTIGTDEGTAAAIGRMGATNVPRRVTEAAVDRRNRVATAPAYMDGAASPWQVYEGIGRMIEETLRLAST